MRFSKILIILFALVLVGCSSDSSDNTNALSAVRNITTPEDFNATIVGRQLVFINADGTRNPEAKLVVNASNKVTGFTQNGDVDLDWFWVDTAWCRSGVTGLPDNPTTEELECQAVDVNNNIVNFTRDRGAGEIASSWFIE